MPLAISEFYQTHLASLHQQLQTSPITRAYLTGTGIRFDGSNLMPEDQFELPFGNFSTQEFAHLFSIFDGSRVHQQAAKEPVQDAPPGLYQLDATSMQGDANGNGVPNLLEYALGRNPSDPDAASAPKWSRSITPG